MGTEEKLTMSVRNYGALGIEDSKVKQLPVRDSFSREFTRPVLSVLLLSVPLLNLNFPNILRLPLFIAICLIGYKSVYSTFAVLIASIIIPDSGLGPLTATQFAMIMWFVSWMLWQRDHRFYLPKSGLIFLWLMLTWLAIAAMVNSETTMLFEFLKVVGVVLIGLHVLSLQNVKSELCLLSIILVLGLAALPYYLINVLHLPGFENQRIRADLLINYFSYRSNEFRYSIAKQDPNAVSVLLSVAFWCSINLVVRVRSLSLPSSYRWFGLFGFLMLPPLIAAESRAGYIMLLVGSLITVFFMLFGKMNVDIRAQSPVVKNNKFKGVNSKSAVVLIAIVIIVVGLVAVVNTQANLQIIERINGIISILLAQGLGDRGVLARTAWNAIIEQSPVFGIGTTKYLNNISSGIATHNTFLDMGVAAGLPGMVIMVVVIFYPLLGCMKRNKRIGGGIWLIIIGYLISLPFLLSLSIIGDKLFWTLWAMLIVNYDHSFSVFTRKSLSF